MERQGLIPAIGASVRRRLAGLDGPGRPQFLLVRALGAINLYVLLFASVWVALGWLPIPAAARSPGIGWTFAALCAVGLVALWRVPWGRLSSLATLPIFALGLSGTAMLRLVGGRDSAYFLFFLWLWFAALAYPRWLLLLAIAAAVGTHLALAVVTGAAADLFEALLFLIPCYLISCAAIWVASRRLETLWQDRAQARRAAERLAALHDFSALLASEHQVERLMAALVRGLAERFGYRLVSVFLLRDGRLHLQAQVGYTTPITELGLGEGITGCVAQSGRALLVRDGRTHPKYLFAEEHIGSQASVPLVQGGRVLGVLNLEGATGELVEDDLHLLETLAGPTAVAVRNAELVTRLDDLAHRDSLTRLPNRRGIIATLERALETSGDVGDAAGGAVTILLVDLNGFKAVNDRYGHPMGDALLCELAALLQASVRDAADRGDAVGRLGGDEFLIVLPGAGVAAAHEIVARLTANLAGHTFALLATDDGLPPPSVGYSLGVAVAPRDGDEVAALLAAADRAMYHAKRGSVGPIRFATGTVGTGSLAPLPERVAV